MTGGEVEKTGKNKERGKREREKKKMMMIRVEEKTIREREE